MRRLAFLTAILALALPTLAQTQPFEERIDVNLVLIDAIVTDGNGNQILGLTKDDFVITENGVEQQIESVDYFTNRQLLNARETNAPFPVEKVREERYFVFFFDRPTDPGVLFDQLTHARNALNRFFKEEMKEGDRVAIAGHDVRLKIYSDFTSDKAQLKRALDAAAKFGPGLAKAEGSTSGPSLFTSLDTKEMKNNTGTVYEALDLLADALRPIRARKNLVLFSPGIVEPSETISAGMLTSRSRYLDPMLQSLNAANVSVYSVQLQRDVDTTPYLHQRLEEIAEATGGQYFRFNTSFTPALDKIESVNNGYYLISYRSRQAAGEKGFQKVNLGVRNQPQFRVNSRAGYAFGG
ncbi:MAG TPA: VWA domain-containing protein [Thermoanaerobaculia bacterium]|jgi:VWFA-related protein